MDESNHLREEGDNSSQEQNEPGSPGASTVPLRPRKTTPPDHPDEDAWSGAASEADHPPRLPMQTKPLPLAEDLLLPDTPPQAAVKSLHPQKKAPQRWIMRRARFLQSRRSRVIAVIACVLLLLGDLSALTLYFVGSGQYQELMTVAQSGVQDLQNAKGSLSQLAHNPLESKSIAQLQRDLTNAHGHFVQLDEDLRGYPGFLQATPWLGSKLTAALHLTPLAIEATQAGIISCHLLSLLSARLADPLNAQGQGLTPADLALISKDFNQVESLFKTVGDQINGLQPSDLALDSRLGPLLKTVKADLPKMEETFQQIQPVVSMAGSLLGVGQPANFLVEVLDSTELRPGGGFIGNYGILTLSGGRLSNVDIEDVDLLDKDYKYGNKYIPIPSTYSWFTLSPGWGFRDSNLDADFPTSARNAEQLYQEEGGTVPVQGVIAITPWLIQAALKITGPIDVPEYNETITADNLIARIHYHQLTPGVTDGPDYVPDPTGHSSLRKRFTSYLFEHFLDKVKQLSSKEMPQFVQLFSNGVRSKDIQLYLNANSAEALLADYHLASSIQAPSQGDSLFVVDSNDSANKANDFITTTLSDQISIDATGTATHTTTLTYSWAATPTSQANNYGPFTYSDYVRVYVPPAAVLQAQSGWVPAGTSTAFGRRVWAGNFTLQYGQTSAITLTWTVPAAATKGTAGWHYQSLLQKQAGITWHVDIQVALPACATLTGTPAGLTAQSARSLALNQALTADETLDVTYTCA
jgi:hypothetical protein